MLSYYLTGASLDEALGYAKGPSAANPVPADEAREAFPEIMAVGAHSGPETHLAVFEEGLDLILDWMDRELQA